MSSKTDRYEEEKQKRIKPVIIPKYIKPKYKKGAWQVEYVGYILRNPDEDAVMKDLETVLMYGRST